MKTITDLANRRQYFRLVDTAYVEISPLTGEESVAEHFDIGLEFGLIAEFQQLDVESKHLLHGIAEKDKSVGQYLNVLNKKLDSLSRALALSKQDLTKEHIQEINLSEGGLSIMQPQKFKDGQNIAIKLILLPSYSGLLLEGKVLCSIEKESGFEVHIEYTDITDAHRQLIARHIMRKQSQVKHQHTKTN